MTLFYLCLAWVAGIATGSTINLPNVSLIVSGSLGFIFALTFRDRLRLMLLLPAVFLIGSARMVSVKPAPGPEFVASYIGDNREFVLILQEDARVSGKRLSARASILRTIADEKEVTDLHGDVLFQLSKPPPDWLPEYGHQIRVTGRLVPPPEVEGFDYPEYLARKNIYAVLEDPQIHEVSPGRGHPIQHALLAVRRNSLLVLESLFPQPESSLLSGILLGEESKIPDPIQEAFSRTGTSHIVAISGFNISIIAGMLLSLTRRFPARFPSWLFAGIGIALYTILVGASASVVRSAIMGFLSLLARSLGRRSHGMTSLAFSGAVMSLADPWILWDIGFQLSVSATLGLILYADPLQQACAAMLGRFLPAERARKGADLASEIFFMTIAAQITTLPLLLFHFQSFSWSSLCVNPLILPVQPMVMIAGGMVLILGTLYLPLGRLIAWAAWAPTAYSIRIVEAGAQLPGGWQPVGEMPAAWILFFYVLLFGFTILAEKGKLPVIRWGESITAKAVSISIPLLAAAVFSAWYVWFHAPDGRLRLVLLDARGGEAMLVVTPSGKSILINSGSDSLATVVALDRSMGLWNRNLEWVIVAANDSRTNAGWQEIAGKYEIGSVLIPPGGGSRAPEVDALIADCFLRQVPLWEGAAGSSMDLGDGGRIEILAASETGLILSLEYGNARWLIPSGLNPEWMRDLTVSGRIPQAQVLVLAGRGNPAVNSREWIYLVQPVLGLSPGGEDAILVWPEELPLLRTDLTGQVEILTDGKRLWVRRG